MSIYALKPRFQALLRPGVTRLAAAGVTANQVTLGTCALSLLVAVLVSAGADWPAVFLLVPLWMLARMALNAVDGMLAREFAQASPLGAYLNEITDVLADAALYWPFALLPGSGVGPIALVVVLAGVSELTGLAALLTGASRRYDGPMGKSDRAFVFGALYLFIGCGVPHHDHWSPAVLALVNLLLIATIARRMKSGLREVAGKTP